MTIKTKTYSNIKNAHPPVNSSWLAAPTSRLRSSRRRWGPSRTAWQSWKSRSADMCCQEFVVRELLIVFGRRTNLAQDHIHFMRII